MPKCFKREMLEYLLAPELDSVILEDVVKLGKECSMTEIASTILELALVIYVKTSLISVLYKVIVMSKREEMRIMEDENIEKLIEGMRMSITPDSLDNKRFVISVDTTSQTSKLLELAPISILFSNSSQDPLLAQVLNSTTDLASFIGMFLLYLCSMKRESDLGLDIFVDFLDRHEKSLIRNSETNLSQKSLDFATGLLLFYPDLFHQVMHTGNPTQGISYSQFNLSKCYNQFTRESALLSIKSLIADSASYNEFFSLIEPKSLSSYDLNDLIRKSMEEIADAGKYDKSSPISLILPEKIWDICTGIHLATLLLSPEWTYTNVYKAYVFGIFSGSEQHSVSRLAAICYIGSLFRCVAENFPLVEANVVVYQEYIARLVLVIKEQNPLLTLHEKCWACYWLLKVNKMSREELAILKQWFNDLSEEQRELLPHNIYSCLSDIKVD